MEVNFYLKSDKNKERNSIRMHCTFDGKILRYPVGLSVDPKQWSKDKQKILSGVKDAETLNDHLSELASAAKKEYYRCRNTSNPCTVDYLKQYLIEKFRNIEEKSEYIDEYFIEYMKDRSKRVADRTNAKFKTFYNHLIEIQKYYKKRLTYTNLDHDFYDKFIDYFVFVKKHENRTIKDKHLSILASFLNWSVSRSYIDKNPYRNKKFPYKINPADTVSLTDQEVRKLYHLNTNNDALDRAKDIFCLECFCGLRFSDTNKITPENLKGNHLEIFPEKGDKKIYIPLRTEALNLIHKYFDQNQPFPYLTNQNLNDYLKNICEMAEFEEPVSILSISGNKRETKVFKKYELISTHTARRTFVTLSVERGMNFLDIMAITGHTKLDTFMKYYRPGQSKISENFFNAYARIKPAYSSTEIISNLLKKGVDKEIIAEAFGIEPEIIS